jgi:cytochrome c peroxidase
MFKKIILTVYTVTILISKELITPIPTNADYNYNKALLGKKLFFDVRLSRNNTISCASCHMLQDGGDDNLPVSFGIDGKQGIRNSPTVLNARYNKSQFWDGNAKDLAEQVSGPIHNPIEMGSSFSEIIAKLNKDKSYVEKFSKFYDDGITSSNITDAIVEFEKALTTPNSKFDKYLRGNQNILTKDELNGYMLFKDYGCISCHNGVNIGGNLLQKIGAVEKFDTSDFGLYNITKKEEDKFYFKVPSLRNVELTAPYYHDGRVKSLEEAVDNMVKHQVGFLIDEKDREDIVKFLKTLTGETPTILRDSK